jgi:tRNA-dihydrouridine synthase B
VTFKSGSLECSSEFILAPMEGVSDVAFRSICKKSGAGFTYVEMLRARALAKRNNATLALVDTFDDDNPCGIQLLATNERELLDAVTAIFELPQAKNVVAIDLNFGCPSPDIIKIGAGPAMLKRRAKLRSIFEGMRALKARFPQLKSVSAKIRLGLNAKEQEHKVYVPVVEMANDTLDHLTVHARHAGQKSRDAPTWSAIGEAKVHAKIPIIGNGDVFTRADALRMQSETHCDGFLIARAAIRDPWCFRELLGRAEKMPTRDEIESAAREVAEWHRRYPPRDKHRTFHADLWARLRSGSKDVVVPRNAHLS